MSGSLVSELEHLANALGVEPSEGVQVSLAGVAEKLAKNLGVKPDEIAILYLSTKWRRLHFLVPERLQHVGSIPLTHTSSLAARTARESRPEIVNNFAFVQHATVFEGVPLAGRDKVVSIQKIISAPILVGDKVIGVIQVSRKGKNPSSAGRDFTPEDLGKVLALCRPLGKLLQHFARE